MNHIDVKNTGKITNNVDWYWGMDSEGYLKKFKFRNCLRKMTKRKNKCRNTSLKNS